MFFDSRIWLCSGRFIAFHHHNASIFVICCTYITAVMRFQMTFQAPRKYVDILVRFLNPKSFLNVKKWMEKIGSIRIAQFKNPSEICILGFFFSDDKDRPKLGTQITENFQ